MQDENERFWDRFEDEANKRWRQSMMYKRNPRWKKPLAIVGLILYTICAGIGCGWVMTRLINVIG